MNIQVLGIMGRDVLLVSGEREGIVCAREREESSLGYIVESVRIMRLVSIGRMWWTICVVGKM